MSKGVKFVSGCYECDFNQEKSPIFTNMKIDKRRCTHGSFLCNGYGRIIPKKILNEKKMPRWCPLIKV